MAFDPVKVFASVNPIVFAVLLFFAEVVINVKGAIFVANVGDNITLLCNPDRLTGYLYWRRNNSYIAGVDTNYPSGGIYKEYRDIRLSQLYEVNDTARSFKLYTNDVRVTDSAKYTCVLDAIPPYHEEYDVRVIGCSPCLVNPSQGSDPEGVDVTCHLDNIDASTYITLDITLNSKEENVAVINGSNLSFTTSRKMIYNDTQIMFNPYDDTSRNILCVVPAQPSTPSSTMISTTSESYTTRKDNATVLIILIIAILGSIFVFILMAIILVLRFRKTRHRNQTKSSKTESNVSAVDKAVMEECGPCYESTVDTPRAEPGVNNILQDSKGEINASSFLRSSGQLDTVLYTLPDKTGIINRFARSKVIDNSPEKANVLTNDTIIHDNEHNGGHLQKKNLYEQVDIPGPRAGDDCGRTLYATPDEGQGATENNGNTTPEPEAGNDSGSIPLYAMPHKAGSTGNAAKASTGPKNSCDIPLYAMPDKGPGSAKYAGTASVGDESADIPLYAMPDKGPRSTGKTTKAMTTGPELDNDSGVIPLYAMPNKGPGSTGNAGMSGAMPDKETISIKDDVPTVNALYAEVKEPIEK